MHSVAINHEYEERKPVINSLTLYYFPFVFCTKEHLAFSEC